ncbi:MAG: hypothetical protein K9G46_01445 [Flavobacteriales bacterium]|jgi:hypothetical protein|nr:hypothetical protein [Flavobacteriales bacterium]
MKTLLCLLLLSTIPFHDGNWELKKDKEGIKVYTKHVEGSGLKAIKATTVFNASLETCVAVLRDIDHLTELFPDTKVVKKISQTANDQVHYLEMDAPWPVTDRDGAFLLVYKYDATTQTVLVDAKMKPDACPVKDGIIRLSKGGGTWKFKRIDATHTSLEYYFHGDPGGNIPTFLANSVVEENPLKMLTNYHALVKLERYQGKKFSFIK